MTDKDWQIDALMKINKGLREALEYIEFCTHMEPAIFESKDTSDREIRMLQSAMNPIRMAAEKVLKPHAEEQS